MPTFVVSFPRLMSGTIDKLRGWALRHSGTQRVIFHARANAAARDDSFEFVHRPGRVFVQSRHAMNAA